MALIVVPLPRGLVAQILIDEERDRPPYTPPPVPRDAHDAACSCWDCVMLRNRTERGVV